MRRALLVARYWSRFIHGKPPPEADFLRRHGAKEKLPDFAVGPGRLASLDVDVSFQAQGARMDVASTDGEILERKRWRLRLPERLPNLKGKWLTLYTIVWAIMLPVALIGGSRGVYLNVTTPTMWTPYGFATTEDSSGIHVDTVMSSTVHSLGLRSGDYVVAVDGWAVPRTAARAAARTHVVKPEGSLTRFTFRRPDGQTYAIRLVRSVSVEEQFYRDAGVSRTFAKAMDIFWGLSIPCLFIGASILLFVRRRREAVPALFAVSFLMIAAVLNGGDMLGINVTVVGIFSSVAICLLLGALFAFPSGRFEPRWTAVPFLLCLLPPIVASDTVSPVLVAGLCLLAIVALGSRYRKLPTGPERLQIRWAFHGFVIGALLFVIAVMIQISAMNWQAEDPRWVAWQYSAGPTLLGGGLCAMALGLIVSILRYRLYDADAVIGRSAAYGVLTLGFVVLFAGSQKIIELLGQQYLGQNVGGFAGGIGAALAAVAIAPMHARAQRWAERSFQRSLYKLRHGLPPLVGDLRETSGLEQIAGATLDSLVEGVRTCRAALVAGKDLVDAREIAPEKVQVWRRGWSPPAHDGIDCQPSDALFPVRVPLEAEGHGRVGWLLLGPRPDGSLFGKAEFDAVEEVAEAVARAVQVAIGRQEREDRYEQRFETLERLVAQLRAEAKPSTA
jgi:hypothetical protein